MKVFIITDDGKEHPLNQPDVNFREHPSDLTVNGVRSVQDAAFLRGDEIESYGRGSHKTSVAFTIFRLFETIQDAQEWMLTNQSNVENGGVIKFAFGSNFNRYAYMKAGAIASIDASHIGVSVKEVYQIVGGKITLEEP